MQTQGPPGTWELSCSPRGETLRAASNKQSGPTARALAPSERSERDAGYGGTKATK
jgi:hypothetical protein